jgi:hypothetical protein
VLFRSDKVQYAQRVQKEIARDRGSAFAMSATQVVSAVSRTEEFKTGSWNDVASFLSAHMFGPLEKYTTDKYLEARQDDIAKLPKEQQEAAVREARFRAQADVGAIAEFFYAETLGAFVGSRGGTYNPDLPYDVNLATAKPPKPPADTPQRLDNTADSNNTLPAPLYPPHGDL